MPPSAVDALLLAYVICAIVSAPFCRVDVVDGPDTPLRRVTVFVATILLAPVIVLLNALGITDLTGKK